MKKRILITTESLIMGGVETTLLSFLKFLNQFDVEIDLFVLEKGALAEEFSKLNNVQIIPTKIPKNKAVYRVMKNLLCSSLIKKYRKINQKEYDIAIAFYGINNYADMYAASANAKNKIIWVHNNFKLMYQLSNHQALVKARNKIIQKKFKYFDKIVTVSESAKKGFLQIFKKYEEKIEVINNFIDTKRIEGRKEKCDLKMVGNNNLIYVGRLVDTKKVDLLILEFKKVLDEIKDANLYIVGDGPEKDNLMKLVNSEELDKKVHFLGNQNNPFKYIEQSDIVVTASKAEACSINSLEALAMNKYFVSADNEGAEDIFFLINKANLNNGIVCKTEYMHKFIINYLKNRKKFKPDFDVETINKNIEDKLITCLNLKSESKK